MAYLHKLFEGARVELLQSLPILKKTDFDDTLPKGLKGNVVKLCGAASMLVVVKFDNNKKVWVDARKLKHIANSEHFKDL